jgi:hypothetical protein
MTSRCAAPGRSALEVALLRTWDTKRFVFASREIAAVAARRLVGV